MRERGQEITTILLYYTILLYCYTILLYYTILYCTVKTEKGNRGVEMLSRDVVGDEQLRGQEEKG